MIKSRVKSYLLKLLTAVSAEWSAGSRKKDLLKRTLRLSHQALPDRRMLGIDRTKGDVLLLYERHNDRTAGNESLLICQFDLFSRVDRGNDRS